MLDAFAVHQGDRLGVLPGPGQAEAQVGLHRLQAVGGLDQRTPQQQAEHGAATGIEEGQHDQVARHLEAGAGDWQAARHAEQDLDETAEDQQRIEQGEDQADRRLGGDADVLGDASVGIVVFAAGELQLVVPGMGHPVVEQAGGQPAPPVQLQPALDVQMHGGDQHGQHEDQHEGEPQHQQVMQ
ncbi:hypothetical protein D3C78_663420 [compost metagenome]